MTYATGTSVSVERSKAQLEATIRQHGGYNYGSATLDAQGIALVHFTVGTGERMRQVRLHLPLPKQTQYVATRRAKGKSSAQLWEQACRERWRILVLAVKAKLELVAVGGSTIEREFLADLALPDGSTVSERLTIAIAEAYSSGKMPPMLGGGAPAAVVEGELEP